MHRTNGVKMFRLIVYRSGPKYYEDSFIAMLVTNHLSIYVQNDTALDGNIGSVGGSDVIFFLLFLSANVLNLTQITM